MTATWIPSLPTGTFGQRLRVMRLASDLTIDQAAEACDVPAVTWRTWEKGAKPRDMEVKVRQIHRAMAVDLDWLMWGMVPDGYPSGGGDETPPDLPSSNTTWNVGAAWAAELIEAEAA